MLSINFAYRFFKPSVERWQPPVLWIAGFIDGIISHYPRVSFIAGSNLLPEPDRAILVVLIVPKSGVVCRVVAVPVACANMSSVLDPVSVFRLSSLTVLTTWDCMHIDDGVDVMPSTLPLSHLSNILICPSSIAHSVHTLSLGYQDLPIRQRDPGA